MSSVSRAMAKGMVSCGRQHSAQCRLQGKWGHLRNIVKICRSSVRAARVTPCTRPSFALLRSTCFRILGDEDVLYEMGLHLAAATAACLQPQAAPAAPATSAAPAPGTNGVHDAAGPCAAHAQPRHTGATLGGLHGGRAGIAAGEGHAGSHQQGHQGSGDRAQRMNGRPRGGSSGGGDGGGGGLGRGFGRAAGAPAAGVSGWRTRLDGGEAQADAMQESPEARAAAPGRQALLSAGPLHAKYCQPPPQSLADWSQADTRCFIAL